MVGGDLNVHKPRGLVCDLYTLTIPSVGHPPGVLLLPSLKLFLLVHPNSVRLNRTAWYPKSQAKNSLFTLVRFDLPGLGFLLWCPCVLERKLTVGSCFSSLREISEWYDTRRHSIGNRCNPSISIRPFLFTKVAPPFKKAKGSHRV